MAEERELFRHQLLVGIHQGEDLTQPEILHPETGKPTGRFPPRVYTAGESFDSKIDLVKAFGAQKFAYAGDRPRERRGARATVAVTPGQPAENMPASVAPAGQVSSGRQVTRAMPDGTRVSGAMTSEEEEKFSDITPAGHEEAGPDHGSPDAPAVGDANLNEMTVAELKEHAADNEIDLGGATHKAEILSAIRKSRKASSATSR